MRNKFTALYCLAALALAATSCRLGPEYRRPDIAMPATFRGMQATDTSLADARYSEVFNDPILNEHIESALRQNNNLLATLARIDQVRAGVTIQSAQWYPSLDVGFSATEAKLSQNRYPSQAAAVIGSMQDAFGLSAMLNWEIDVFGRIARGTEAQRARLSASFAGRRAAIVTTVSSVAETYTTLLELEQLKRILDSNLANRKEYLGLAKTLFDGGKTSELDYRQAEAEFHRIEVAASQTDMMIAQTENALNVLFAQPAGTAIRRGTLLESITIPESLPTGLPVSMLERRPDIQLAEYELMASTSEVGVAVAQQFPRVALAADVGLQSINTNNLFDPASVAYSFAGNLLQPVFNAGRNAARVDAADAVSRQAEYGYRNAVLAALREVADAAVSITSLRKQVTSAEKSMIAVQEVLRLSQLRYRYGAAPYLQVLDAQRSLLDAQRTFISAKAQLMRSYIQLYKALGGGWQQ